MTMLQTCLRTVVRELIRLITGVYFNRIERFHRERVPPAGPVLFVGNHPGSITDAFLIGVSVPRPVSFVGTVQLFRLPLLGWLLRNCGIIAINRVKDDPRAMRTVLDTFEACFAVLEQGGAIGIFPEGMTYNDARLRPVKTGAARMALELEHRHEGKLGLKIVPVGLTYSRKERYRSDVLVHFGEPLVVTDFLAGYGERRKERIQALSTEIEQRIQALVLHLPGLEQARLVRAITRLYLERLKVGRQVITEAVSPRAEELVLTQTIAAVVDHYARHEPERVAHFTRHLQHYERCLKRLRLEDNIVDQLDAARRPTIGSAGRTLLTVAGLPIAIYGWAHRLLPALAVDWAVRRFTVRGARKAQTPHVAALSGLVLFGFAYVVYVTVVHRIWGWPVSLWYAMSLPVAGLLAHYYTHYGRRVPQGLRALGVRLRAPFVAQALVRQRAALIAEIDAGRAAYQAHLTNHGGAPPAGPQVA
jgi:1-acyl-sn-glycerol-3-phosphate acyltransferase